MYARLVEVVCQMVDLMHAWAYESVKRCSHGMTVRTLVLVRKYFCPRPDWWSVL